MAFGFGARMAAGAVAAVGVALAAYFIYQSTVTEALPPQPATLVTPPPVAAAKPAQPVVEIPAPSFDVVRIEPDGSSVIAGNATAGAPVTIMLDDTEIGQATADAQGNFVAMLSLPANTDAQVLSLSAQPSEGAAVVSTDSVIIAPVTPVATPEGDAAKDQPTTPEALTPANAPPNTLPNTPAVLLANEQGVRVLQPATPNPSVINNVVIDAIAYDAKGEVQLSGRGAGTGYVRIYLNDAPLQTSRIDDKGSWHTVLPDVDTGIYTLRVDQVDAAGSVTSRTETPFKREAAATLQTTQTSAENQPVSAVTVQPGSTLWAIARDRYGDGTLYVRVFEANRANIRNPDLIYPGQVFEVPN